MMVDQRGSSKRIKFRLESSFDLVLCFDFKKQFTFDQFIFFVVRSHAYAGSARPLLDQIISAKTNVNFRSREQHITNSHQQTPPTTNDKTPNDQRPHGTRRQKRHRFNRGIVYFTPKSIKDDEHTNSDRQLHRMQQTRPIIKARISQQSRNHTAAKLKYARLDYQNTCVEF